MLTVTYHEDVISTLDNAAQIEIPLTDSEVMDRVQKIRRGWSARERAARRLEAERRFSALVDALCNQAA